MRCTTCWLLLLLLAGCVGTPAPVPPEPAVPPTIEVASEPQAAPAPEPGPDSQGPACRYGSEGPCRDRCQAGDEVSCGLLAAMYVNADGVAADHARARELAERGCAEHDPRACNVLGYLLERGLGGGVDTRRALELYRVACHGGEMRSCYNIGRAHHYGVNGVAKDDARAAALFVRACQTGLAQACSAAASLADSDPAAQLRYYEIACRAGDEDGCRGLVTGYARRVSAEPVDLWPKLQAACDAGSADSCKALGDLHTLGLGDGAQPGVSEQLYERACKLGSVDGCARHGAALLDAGADGSERQRAVQLLDDGCRVGDIWACLRLRRLDGSDPGIDAPL